MHRIDICDALLPNQGHGWELQVPVGSATTVPAACLALRSCDNHLQKQHLQPPGVDPKLSEDEGQRSLRQNNVFRGHSALTLLLKPRSTRFENSALPPHCHAHRAGDVPEKEYLYLPHREILVQRVPVACRVRLETKEQG